MPLKTIGFLAILSIACACQRRDTSGNEQAVARVYNSLLYPSDLAGQIDRGLSDNDSSLVAKRLIEEWVRNKLLLREAENALSENEKSIQKQVDEYRSSLLIYKYKQDLLSANLDTMVSEEEILDYYTENSSNYISDADLIRVNYVKVPVSSTDVSSIRRWYRSEKEDDLSQLQNYCLRKNIECLIQSEWEKFSEFAENTNLTPEMPKHYQQKSHIEINKDGYFHFIYIIEKISEGNISPFALVKDDIHSVIMNKRKVQYIKDMENTVYKEGLSRNQVVFY